MMSLKEKISKTVFKRQCMISNDYITINRISKLSNHIIRNQTTETRSYRHSYDSEVQSIMYC